MFPYHHFQLPYRYTTTVAMLEYHLVMVYVSKKMNIVQDHMSRLKVAADADQALWKEHANQLEDVQIEQAKIQEALDLLSMSQRQIIRSRRDSFGML